MSQPSQEVQQHYKFLFSKGLKLVPLKPNTKAPAGQGWNLKSQTLANFDTSVAAWGLPLAENKRCSIDPDVADLARAGLLACGFDLDLLLSAGVQTASTRPGSGGRSMFVDSAGLEWIRFASKEVGIVLELRASSANLQDVVPGLEYFSKGAGPYTQNYVNGKTYADAVDLPEKFAAWWRRLGSDVEFKKAEMQKFFTGVSEVVGYTVTSNKVFDDRRGVGIPLSYKKLPQRLRELFIATTFCEDLFDKHGFVAHENNEWSHPGSTSGAPGIKLVSDKKDLWIHFHGGFDMPAMFDAWVATVQLEFDGNEETATAYWLPILEEKYKEQAGTEFDVVADAMPLRSKQAADLAAQFTATSITPAAAGGGSGGGSGGGNRNLSGLVFPHMSPGRNPKPLNTVENFAALARHLGVSFAYDVWLDREIVGIPNFAVTDSVYDNCALTWLTSEASRAELPTGLVAEYAALLCAGNPFDGPRAWVMSQPWDGVTRLPAFFNTITAENTWLKERLIYRWLIGAAAALMKPGGVALSGVLTLLGPQGVGKTSWFKRLTPSDNSFSKDSVVLRPDNKDSVKQAVQFWLTELGELDGTFKKADIAALKAFITSDFDIFRQAYARKETRKPRRTSFFASVNEETFLNDSTGNRRFWTIDCQNIDYEHDVDMQQLWAEVVVLYNSGEHWHLDEKESAALSDSNENYTVVDAVEESILTAFAWESNVKTWRWLTVTEVLKEIGIFNPTRNQTIFAGKTLSKQKKCLRSKSHGVVKRFVPPIKIDDF